MDLGRLRGERRVLGGKHLVQARNLGRQRGQVFLLGHERVVHAVDLGRLCGERRLGGHEDVVHAVDLRRLRGERRVLGGKHLVQARNLGRQRRQVLLLGHQGVVHAVDLGRLRGERRLLGGQHFVQARNLGRQTRQVFLLGHQDAVHAVDLGRLLGERRILGGQYDVQSIDLGGAQQHALRHRFRPAQIRVARFLEIVQQRTFAGRPCVMNPQLGQDTVELGHRGALRRQSLARRLAAERGEEIPDQIGHPVLRQDLDKPLQAGTPLVARPLAQPGTIQKERHYRGALDVGARVALLDRAGRVDPIGQQGTRKKMDALLLQCQAQQELQVVGIAQRRKIADRLERGTPDEQVGRRYDEICAAQCQRPIARFPVERQGVLVPLVGLGPPGLVDEGNFRGHDIGRRVGAHCLEAQGEPLGVVAIVGVQDGDELAGCAMNRRIERVVSTLVGPGPEDDFRMVLAHPPHPLRRAVGGSVVHDDDFRGTNGLPEHAFERGLDVSLVVVQRNDDRYAFDGRRHAGANLFAGSRRPIGFGGRLRAERNSRSLARRGRPLPRFPARVRGDRGFRSAGHDLELAFAGIEVPHQGSASAQEIADCLPLLPERRLLFGCACSVARKFTQQSVDVRHHLARTRIVSDVAGIVKAVPQGARQEAFGEIRDGARVRPGRRQGNDPGHPRQLRLGIGHQRIEIDHDPALAFRVANRGKHVERPQQVRFLRRKAVPRRQRARHAERVAQRDHIAFLDVQALECGLPERKKTTDARVLEPPQRLPTEVLLQDFARDALTGPGQRRPFLPRWHIETAPAPARETEQCVVQPHNVRMLEVTLRIPLVRVEQPVADEYAKRLERLCEDARSAAVHPQNNDGARVSLHRASAETGCEAGVPQVRLPSHFLMKQAETRARVQSMRHDALIIICYVG